MNFSNSPLIPPLSPSLRGRAVPAGRRIARLFTFAFRVTCRVGTRLPGCPEMNLPAYVSGGGRGVTCPLSDGRLCSQQYPFAEALKRTPNFFRPSGMMSKYITRPRSISPTNLAQRCSEVGRSQPSSRLFVFLGRASRAQVQPARSETRWSSPT